MDEDEFDTVVYGSTSGAVAAAIQSARLDRKVVLVSPHKHIGKCAIEEGVTANAAYIVSGGIQIEGLGSTDIDNQAEFQNSGTLGGLSLEFHQRLSRHYDRLPRLEKTLKTKVKDAEVWKFESHVAEAIISTWLREHDIRIITVCAIN